MKKAYELGVLCGCEIGLVVFSDDGKLSTYSSNGDLDRTIYRYTQMEGDYERRHPEDYKNENASDQDSNTEITNGGADIDIFNAELLENDF